MGGIRSWWWWSTRTGIHPPRKFASKLSANSTTRPDIDVMWAYTTLGADMVRIGIYITQNVTMMIDADLGRYGQVTLN